MCVVSCRSLCTFFFVGLSRTETSDRWRKFEIDNFVFIRSSWKPQTHTHKYKIGLKTHNQLIVCPHFVQSFAKSATRLTNIGSYFRLRAFLNYSPSSTTPVWSCPNSRVCPACFACSTPSSSSLPETFSLSLTESQKPCFYL